MIWFLVFLLTVGTAQAEEIDRGALAARRMKERSEALSAFKRFRHHVEVEKNDALANKWGRIAADKGNVEAMVTIGQWLDYGWAGNPENDRAALDFYSKAALKNSAIAWYLRGNLYLEGHGVPVDRSNAQRSYEMAIKTARASKDPDGIADRASAALAKLTGKPVKPVEARVVQRVEPPSSPPVAAAPPAVSEPAPEPKPTPTPEKKQEFPNASRWAKKIDHDEKKAVFLTIYSWKPKTDVYEVRRRDPGPEGWSWAMTTVTGDELRNGWKLQSFDPAWCKACRGTGKERRKGEDKEGFTTVYHPGGPGSSVSSGMYFARTTESTFVFYSCGACDGRGWNQPSFGIVDL